MGFGVLRIRVVLMVLLSLVGGSCSDPYEGGLEGAPGAWLAFSTDVNEAGDLLDQIVSVPAQRGGQWDFLPGIGGAARNQDEKTGEWGYRVVFRDSAPDETRQTILERTIEAGVPPPVWLGLDDPWTDCNEEPDCQLVREALGK